MRCATSPSAPASTTSSSLVAMLVQTDKFGTSVAQSLRVHSETLRTKRRQRAEEAAAKTGVKMVFPLVFCIFPAIWVVTIGPAAIKFVQVLCPDGAEMSAMAADITRRRHARRRRRFPRTLEDTGLPRRSGRTAARQDAVRRRADRPARSPSACGCRTRILEPLIERLRAERLDRGARRHRHSDGRATATR